MQFVAELLSISGPMPDAAASAYVESGHVKLSGTVLQAGCGPVGGYVTRHNNDVTAHIGASPATTPCDAVLEAWRYSGVLHGLEPGTYRLKVVHFPQGLSAPGDTMLELVLVLP
jgi:hypothetical protein